MSYLIEVGIILILIGLNGLFAMSEFAIVSAKKALLRLRSEEGDPGAAAAIRLSEDPTPFLSTIQIGITLVGIIAGAFGGVTLAKEISPFFVVYPALAPYSEALSVGLVVLTITYLTLVFGELVPKRIALGNAEAIASGVARPMHLLSRVAAPLVFVLSTSTRAVLRLLGVRDDTVTTVSEDEVRFLLEEGTRAGVFEKTEQIMVEGVFDLADRRVESLMTHRPDIVALDLREPDEENLRKMRLTTHSNFPAYEENLDNILGMVSVKSVFSGMLDTGRPDLRSAVTTPVFVPETLR
ncbi:MAG: HlyC/CorC family transporter, partial [Methanomicrobiaceae archaeon]|nr:HlyC/CorC family transporter [Methanomicrobiaceae archaeon]